MIRHDPKQLAARYEAFRAGIDAVSGDIDAQIKALEERRSQAVKEYAEAHPTFADGRLYSATARCKCGAGLIAVGEISGQWVCAKSFKAGQAGDESFDHKEHEAFPYTFYDIKAETQPSACGATTRDEPVEFGP